MTLTSHERAERHRLLMEVVDAAKHQERTLLVKGYPQDAELKADHRLAKAQAALVDWLDERETEQKGCWECQP